MTDARMDSTGAGADGFPAWDFYVAGGIVPLVTDRTAEDQAAAVAAFLIVGGIPQLPAYGVPWLDTTNGDLDFAAVDQAIRSNLAAESLPYAPTYDIVNARVVCNLVRGAV